MVKIKKGRYLYSLIDSLGSPWRKPMGSLIRNEPTSLSGRPEVPVSPSALTAKNTRQRWLKRFLILVLFGIAVYLFLPLVGEIRAAAGLFRTADWRFFALAVLAQAVSYTCYTSLNVVALKPFPGKIGFANLMGVLTAMTFIQVGLPSFGVSSAALRIHLLGKFGYKPEESLVSMAMESLAEALALITVIFFGIGFILRSGSPSPLERMWIPVLSIAILFTFGLLIRLLADRKRVQRTAQRLASLWNPLFGRWLRLDVQQLQQRLEILQENLRHYRRGDLWKLCLYGLGKVYLDVLCLGCCFYMFNYPITLGTMLTGYGLILFFCGLYGLASGPGTIDPFIPVIFSWFNIPGATAIAAGLTYRLIAFWSIRLIGFFWWQYLEGKNTAVHV
jgi:uncharacterized protein (TIRG00374 family)